MRLGGFCATRSAFPITALSTIAKCATSSAADHLPAPGLVFHSSADTASAADKSPFCDLAMQAIMDSSSCGTATFWFASSDGTAASLLESVRELQYTGLPKRGPENLQAHGQLPANSAAGDGDARHSRQGSRNCIYISKIHLQGVGGSLPELERRNRRCRRHNHIHLPERILKILR